MHVLCPHGRNPIEVVKLSAPRGDRLSVVRPAGKHPLCIGAARRAVLIQLEIQHQQTFADQREFVRFAEEQKLGLDFTSPPKRP